jgi:hypothetical protein
MFTIELTSGSSWNESIKTIDRRRCDTISIAYAAAEGLHWLLETQKFCLARGVTHYRVIQHDEAITGGGSDRAEPLPEPAQKVEGRRWVNRRRNLPTRRSAATPIRSKLQFPS